MSHRQKKLATKNRNFMATQMMEELFQGFFFVLLEIFGMNLFACRWIYFQRWKVNKKIMMEAFVGEE